MKNILITGGTGLVGSRLSSLLQEEGYEVSHLSRNPKDGKYKAYFWDVPAGEVDQTAISSTDAIIHLAGAGVADKRWNDARKRDIYDSRIDSTNLLRKKVKELNPNLQHFISASAIGFYGWDTGSAVVDESSDRGGGFLADVVADWEEASRKFGELSIPNAQIRVGVVLSDKGGALVEIAKPIRFGFGAPLGSGDQYMSWIHLDDLCGIFKHVLEYKNEGVINGVAPQPVTNTELTKAIASVLRKPLFLPKVPKFALRILVGEMADMLVGGNNVSSLKIEKLGYSFAFPDLEKALKDLL
ncbi:MAG: TIGR01777 family oxidoreductase [Bacteroidota bacterium]